MTLKKTITVVISSYKYGHLAAHCIESLLAQSYKADRILFVDDGVGDCKHLKHLYPFIEFTFRKKNFGVVDNFDDMLKKVDTDYCMFLGADNWLRADSLELLSKYNEDIITYDIMVTGDLKHDIYNKHSIDMYPIHGNYYWHRTNRHHGSMLYRTKLAQKFGYRARPGAAFTEEDLYLWNKMIEEKATVKHIPEALLFYRRHKENFNNYLVPKLDISKEEKKSFKKIIKNFLPKKLVLLLQNIKYSK